MLKTIDFLKVIDYNSASLVSVTASFCNRSGCSSVWLEYLVWDQGAEGSSPFTPTILIIKFLYFRLYNMVGLAQLVRALVCGAGGRGFESRIPPHDLKYKT